MRRITALAVLLIVSVFGVQAQVGSRLEFQSEASVLDLTPQLQLQNQHQYEHQSYDTGASELLYVTPIEHSGRPHADSGDMIPGPGASSAAAALEGGVDYEDFVHQMHSYMSDMRDTLMTVPQNLGNAILATWEANAEHSRRKAAEEEKRKPKKPIVHFGKPITVKKMDMVKVNGRMRPAERPIVIQIIMPTTTVAPATAAAQGPIAASSEAKPVGRDRDRDNRGRPRRGRPGPLRKRQTHKLGLGGISGFFRARARVNSKDKHRRGGHEHGPRPGPGPGPAPNFGGPGQPQQRMQPRIDEGV